MSLNPCVIYCRVSSDRQLKEGFSVPAQKRLLEDYARQNNYKISKEFYDDEGAGKSGRKGFTDMVTFLEANPEIRTILVEKTDRLFRNLKDYTLIEDTGLNIIYVRSNQQLGPTASPELKFAHGMQVLIAKHFLDNLSREVMKGYDEKLKMGMYPGRAPFGYRSQRISGKNTLVPYEPEAKLVKRLFELYATGHQSLRTALQQIEDESLFIPLKKPIYIAQAHRILTNPIYYGSFVWHDEVHQGIHEPVISLHLWNKVKEIQNGFITKHPIKRYNTIPYMLKGMMTCGECGRGLTAYTKRGKHIYYRCTSFKRNCTQIGVKEDIIVPQLDTFMEQIHIPSDIVEYLKTSLKELHEIKKDTEDKHRDELERKRQSLMTKLNYLYEDKLNGLIDIELYKQKRYQYQIELDTINDHLQRRAVADSRYYEAGAMIIDVMQNIADLYTKGTKEEKRQILQYIVSNITVTDRKVHIDVKKHFQPFVESVVRSKWQGHGESNPGCQDENLMS